MSRVTLSGFRYAPAIGGAENYARRLVLEIGKRVDFDIAAWLTSQRTDWLAAMIAGERDSPLTYEIDGRRVTALPRWPASTRRALLAMAPGYHVPGSPVPWNMGKLMARNLEVPPGTQAVHNVFMGREAFSVAWLIAARRARIPFVFTPLRHERPLGWNSPAFRRLYAESDAVVALTSGEAAWIAAHGGDPARIHVIGLGPQNDASASPQSARELLGFEGDIVLFLGQLHPYKGYRQLLDAASLLADRRDLRFVFVGPDVRGNASAFDRAPANAVWLGAVSQDMRDSLIAACTVLCVPSSRESFGSVVVEAWSCGKPVIGGPAGATRELVDDAFDGFIVPQDPRVIADRVLRIVDDPELARTMGCRGRQKVERTYGWEAIASAHVAIYESLAS